MRPRQRSGGGPRVRLMAVAASAALVGGLCAVGTVTSGLAAASTANAQSASDGGNSCHLANGIKHVVQIGFDNVHFFRDNPNVPSDLQLMPNLLNFIQNNGVMLSNNHTPLIAHTAVDLLTTATGLYGDRHGMPISNSYRAYNADGTTDPAGSFAYWTDPVFDTASTPNPGNDTNPNMVYSPTPPATTHPSTTPDKVTPAPWVPFTRAGCNVGEVATANQDLENTALDLPKVFGQGSPEAQQLANDSDPFKDAETADYVGIAVHCAKDSAFCADAQAVKFGQTSPSNTASPDLLPDEPGGYNGNQALFGHKYVAPQLGAGTPNLSHDGYQITNAAGNLVDLNGNQINGAFLNNYPGFPGFSNINAAQSLAYAADMLQSGVQVVNMYISDVHGNEHIPELTGQGQPCFQAPAALGSGSACYLAQAAYYNAAFGTFFQRLAAEGVTPQNTLFVVSPDEGDHEAAANVGRAIQPTPDKCDGVTVQCTYPAGSIGELAVNTTGLLASETGNTTPFTMENDTAPEFYLTGNPAPDAPVVRSFEHDVASLTNPLNPYSGTANERITNYLANPVEEGILHIVNADPARTPTLAMFAKPDYFLQASPLSGSCKGQLICVSSGFAWNHGDYAAEINTNFVGFVGPGVQNLGLDGPAADAGTTSSGANSGQTEVIDDHFPGPWVDETDIRPTIMYLTGLQDDYEHDGRVITEILSDPNSALSQPDVTSLGECYKQLNASVGEFGAQTLIASTKAIQSTNPSDTTFTTVDNKLRRLEVARDHLAGEIKGELEDAAFQGKPIFGAAPQTGACQALINEASAVARSS